MNNLPTTANELFDITELTAAFDCNGTAYAFDEVIVEEEPIGVVIDEPESEIGLEYTFENVSYVLKSNNEYKYEFDVFVASDSEEATLLQLATVAIAYSDLAFPIKQVAENLVEINPYNTDYIMGVPEDINDSSFKFSIGGLGSGPVNNNFTTITKEPIPLARVSMTIEDCMENPNLLFDLGFMNSNFYADPQVIMGAISYSPVISFDSEKVPACGCDAPIITSFSPTQINAGADEILTIIGSNFGVFQRELNPGNNGDGSSVLFTNGDYVDNNGTAPPLIAAGRADFVINDILEWTDTRIRLKVPSTDYFKGVHGPAATGKFKVRRGCGKETQSTEQLNIPYALSNYRLTSDLPAFKLGLRNFNGSNGEQDGYIFQYSSNVLTGGSINVKTAFETALQTWCQETKIRFKTSSTLSPTLTATAEDGISSITLESVAATAALGQAGLAVGIQYYKIDCKDNEGERIGYILADLDFKVDPDFFQNGSQLRAIRVFEHELGHAHMINHAKCIESGSCTGPLMEPMGGTSIQPVDVDGAKRIFNTSKAIIESNNCIQNGMSIEVKPIASGECGFLNTVKDLASISFQVTPNPGNDIFLLENLPLAAQLLLVDFTGRRLLAMEIENTSTSLDLTNYPSGTYVLVVSTKASIGHYKIIKL